MRIQLICTTIVLSIATLARANEFQLLSGVDAGLTPGAPRTVLPSSFPASGIPGSFNDGDRLAGTPGTAAATYGGTGTPLISPNAYGSLSFMFRRGSLGVQGAGQLPLMVTDFLGGPLLDLDGDLGNGTRRLTPQSGQTPVEIPGSKSRIDLGLNPQGGTVSLMGFDATSTNQGFQGFGPAIATTVNTLSGTLPNGSNSGAVLNPAIDTRAGALSLHSPNVYRISNLGYELWQDSIDPTSSTASTLGTFQYLGSLRGWYIQRDMNGQFPALAGQGLGASLWSQVNTGLVGATLAQSSGAPPTTTITNGPAGDQFSAPGNGGLPLTAFASDLGAYLDSVVVPLIDPLSTSFVYLESAGVGINNSFDPVFGDTTGYDVVIIAQSAPIPEPSGALAILAALVLTSTGRRAVRYRRRWSHACP